MTITMKKPFTGDHHHPSTGVLDPRPAVGTIYETCFDTQRWKIVEWLPDGKHRYIGLNADGSEKPLHAGISLYEGFPDNFTIVATTDDPNGR